MSKGHNPIHASAIVRWQAITADSKTAWERCCIGEATLVADRLAALQPGPTSSGTHRSLAVRDETWHQTALRWYASLLATGRDDAEPVADICIVAEPSTIQDWLSQHPTLIPDVVADPGRLPDLIDKVQRAALFGMPGHTVRLHNLVPTALGLEEYLLMVDTPAGARLATGRLAHAHLTSDQYGVDAAVAVLQRCADHIDEVMAAHARAADAAPTRARTFPPLHEDRDRLPLTDPALPPASGRSSGPREGRHH
jgi:hypothetical protein